MKKIEGVIGFENEGKDGVGGAKIRLPRSGFVHLNRVLSVVPGRSKELDIRFSQHCKMMLRDVRSRDYR
jgi:hypothetical protein